MSLNDIATIVVSSSGAGVTRQGYGVGMITSFTATWAERFRVYSSLSAVGGDFAANTPEYLAAAAYFNQNPSPTQLVIGRCALTPTQVWSVSVPTGAAQQNTQYGLSVSVATGVVRPVQLATYLSGAGASVWSPSGIFSKGNLIAAGASSLYSCLGVSGPSGLYGNNAATGIAAGVGAGPTGTAGTPIQDGQVYWQYAGAGTTGGVTNDAVILGLQAALDALSAPVVVGTGMGQVTSTTPGAAGSLTLQVQANAPGKFVGLATTNRSALWTAQTQADAGIATDLQAIKNATAAWYGLITTMNSPAIIQAAAAWVESNTKLYPAASADTIVAETGVGSDVASTLMAQEYTRTWVMSHPIAVEFADAAEMGRFFPILPGGETWRMKPLAGITTQTYSDSEQSNLKAKNAHFYYDFGGGFGVVGGNAMSAAGEFVDVVRFLDWYTSNLQGDLADAAVALNKIPFTNQGIDLVEGIVRKRNAAGIAAGGIASSPAPIVTAPDVSDVSATDKSNRQLSGVNTQWTLAGAIHHITVNVTANT